MIQKALLTLASDQEAIALFSLICKV